MTFFPNREPVTVRQLFALLQGFDGDATVRACPGEVPAIIVEQDGKELAVIETPEARV